MAWCQRSYFNFYNIFLIVLLIFILNNNNIFCFNIRGLQSEPLIDFMYKGNTYKRHIKVSELMAINCLDSYYNFIVNNNYFYNFNIAKYYNINSNILINYDKKSYFNHYNIVVGCYNNCNINYCLTHNPFNKENYFDILTKKDIFNKELKQYINCTPYISNNLFDLPVYYNYNSLNLNNKLNSFQNGLDFLLKIKDTKEIQKYLDNYDNYSSIKNKILKNKKFQ